MGNEIIRITNLTKIYKVKKQDIVAIEDVNLSIEEKDIFGIIGLFGAGKSTLIRCINYLEKPTTGEVYFKGTNLARLKGKELRKVRQNIGMIFQGFHLLEQRTVLKNVMFPLELVHVPKEEAKARAKELLELVGLADKIDVYPSQLSGGQKQRVAIARALANQPSVLLCDEATSALDPNTTNSILSLLKDINNKLGITIVIITHEMHVIESICNKVAVIDQSHIEEVGRVEDIFKHPKTSIAKSFFLANQESIDKGFGNTLLRLEFDSNVLESILSNLILETKIPVNIIEANLHSTETKIAGTMVIQLPKDTLKIEKIKQYLTRNQIKFQVEVEK